MTFATRVAIIETNLDSRLHLTSHGLTKRQLRRFAILCAAEEMKSPRADGDTVTDEAETRREESEYSHSEGAHR